LATYLDFGYHIDFRVGVPYPKIKFLVKTYNYAKLFACITTLTILCHTILTLSCFYNQTKEMTVMYLK